jgi:hypothetical protein
VEPDFNERTTFGKYGHWVADQYVGDIKTKMKKWRKGKKENKAPTFPQQKAKSVGRNRKRVFKKVIFKGAGKLGNGRKRRRSKSNSEESELESGHFKPNPFYNLEFCNYALLHIVPYAGILTRGVYAACGVKAMTDSTNTVELWFKSLKVKHIKLI